MTLPANCQNNNGTVHSGTPNDILPSSTKMRYMLPTSISLKNLLPAIAFLFAFATVMTVLVIHMNNTATRHHQFRVNMNQDNEFLGVAQDNPELITYIREVHLTPAVEPHHHSIDALNVILTEDASFILNHLKNKNNGIFIEAGAYNDGKISKTEYLERKLNWHGLLIQPNPSHYFKLRRQNRGRVTYHQEDHDGVKINRIHANTVDDPDWFSTRVKCFPFYSLLLAMNITSIDLFILESGGTELQVLQTIPFQKVKVEVIEVELLTSDLEKDTIKQFLATKNYTFMQNFNNSYVFKINHVTI